MDVQPVERTIPLVESAIRRELHGKWIEETILSERREKISAGTHRFAIYPDQSAFLNPEGAVLNRKEEREWKLKANAASVKLWAGRRAFVTPDGLEIREH